MTRIDLKIRMTLLSDTIFGSGTMEAGGLDISVRHDEYGFPFYKGSTFKGVFRETLEQYLLWTAAEDKTQGNESGGTDEKQTGIPERIKRLLGASGEDIDTSAKMSFTDFKISESIRRIVLEEIGYDQADRVLSSMTNIRRFTSLEEDGTAKEGSLRSARCINEGMVFYGTISCEDEDLELIRDVLPMIKWIGTMRNRGFGRVKFEICEEVA